MKTRATAPRAACYYSTETMNGDPQQTPGSATGLEEDRELWELLACAKRPEASPYFARRVLREATSLPQSAPASALWRGLRTWWQAGLPLLRPPRAAAWPGALAAAAICVLTVMTNLPYRGGSLNMGPVTDESRWSQPEAAVQATVAPGEPAVETADTDGGEPAGGAVLAADDTLTQLDAEVIADLDSLITREETHLWTGDNTAF